MELITTLTSPYGRKARAAILELELEDRVFENHLSPLTDSDNLAAINPLGKVPALLLDDGLLVLDSLTIGLRLAHYKPQQTLIPFEAHERLDFFHRHAVANGIIDAAVAAFMELGRPSEEQSAFWLRRWRTAIQNTLSYCESWRPPEDRFDFADLTMAIAIEYLEFRHADLEWATGVPHLENWMNHVRESKSLSRTAPPKQRA